MLKTRYKLTQADRPQLIEALNLWKQLFGVDLEHAQLIMWAKAAPPHVITKAFHVTQRWVRGRRPSVVTEKDGYNYTTGVIRNMMKVEKDAEDLLGDLR